MIFKLRKDAENAASTLPALMAEAEKAVTSILHGQHAQRKAGSGEKFWQFREYHPSDRPQDIDWRQSAKTDHIYIRQKEWQTTQTSLLWCNQSESMDFSSARSLPTKAFAANVLTLALSILLTRGGEQIGLFGTKRRGRSGAMLDHVSHALLDPKQHIPLLALSDYKLPQHCNLIQLGDFLEPVEVIEPVFKTLAPQTTSGLVIQVLDPAELELPYDGRTIFEEPSAAVRENIDHVTSIRKEYQARIKKHIQGVEDLGKRCGWHVFLHRTDQPVSNTLTHIWERLR